MLGKIISSKNQGLISRLLSENLRRQSTWYVIAIVAMLVVAAMTAASAWMMRDVVNETVVSKDLERLLIAATAVATIFAVKGVATYVQTIFLAKAGNNIIAQTQRKLFRHILKQDVTFHSRYPSSELLMRMTTNAQAVRSVIDLVVTSFVRDLFSLIGLIAVMVIQQPLLSIVSAVVGPIAIFGVRRLTRRVRKIMEQEMLSLNLIIQNVQETAAGIRVVKAFALEDYMNEQMDKHVSDVEKRANSISRLEAASSPIMETLSGFAIAAVIALSGFWVLQEGNTPGELMSFVTALLLAYEPAKRLARVRIALESGLVGVRMMYEILDHPVALEEKDGAIELKSGRGDICFNDVSFSYKPGQQIFDKLNLTFPTGKTTALVGPSGGGKSSIINMIMRLYDPESGSVTIDGQDIKDVTFASLRESMSFVGQETFLFRGSVKHNIGFGHDGASDEEIIEAAKAANAHDFIMAMPDGYDSQVGDNGGNLSGGQRQRIAIARAMLRDSDILILDEATSALDSESETAIRDALAHLSKGRTTIMIAHRLSTVTTADNIVVMEAGKVAEQGPQSELLAHNGPYRRLYDLQLLPNANEPA